MSTEKAKIFPGDASTRDIANALYSEVKDLPIISPHGHVEPELIARNEPFNNPSELFIFKDHYIKRLLHATGVPLSEISGGADPRKAWQAFANNFHVFFGTSSGYWIEHILETIFGISETLNSSNADRIYDHIASHLLEPEMRPRALVKSFRLEVLATTDDPCDDLKWHREVNSDSALGLRLAPTFRPDKYINTFNKDWKVAVDELLVCANQKERTYSTFITALENRRQFFKENGAFSVDVGIFEPFTIILEKVEAEAIFNKALLGNASEEELRKFNGHMLTEMARMSCDDGLVLTIHAGVFRNHSTATFEKFGADTGHDIPVRCEWTNNLRPLLEKYGLHPNLQIILFSLDETNWSREIAPLAGFYSSILIGVPWWFLDAPDAMKRFREATVDIAGFYRGSGFIDDTRAFLSIPARHDLARRSDCAYLATLVTEGRLTFEQAMKIAIDLVTTIPNKAFKL